jgi:hypothetical protein
MDLTAELLPLTVPEVRRLLAPLFHRSSGQDATHVLHQRILAVLTNLSNDITVPPRKDHRRSWRGSSQYFASAVCQRPYASSEQTKTGGTAGSTRAAPASLSTVASGRTPGRRY